MLGISRGPDKRPPEVIAASEKIILGYRAVDGAGVFRCTECGESGPVGVLHKPECSVGKILNDYVLHHGFGGSL